MHFNSRPISIGKNKQLYFSRTLPESLPVLEFAVSEGLPCIDGKSYVEENDPEGEKKNNGEQPPKGDEGKPANEPPKPEEPASEPPKPEEPASEPPKPEEPASEPSKPEGENPSKPPEGGEPAEEPAKPAEEGGESSNNGESIKKQIHPHSKRHFHSYLDNNSNNSNNPN